MISTFEEQLANASNALPRLVPPGTWSPESIHTFGASRGTVLTVDTDGIPRWLAPGTVTVPSSSPPPALGNPYYGPSAFVKGDILYAPDPSSLDRLGIGAQDTFLAVNLGLPVWRPKMVYSNLPAGGGTWANAGDLLFTGGTATFRLDSLTATPSIPMQVANLANNAAVLHAVEMAFLFTFTGAGTGVAAAGLRAAKEQEWVLADSTTWDASFAFYTMEDGVARDKLRVTSAGDIDIGHTFFAENKNTYFNINAGTNAGVFDTDAAINFRAAGSNRFRMGFLGLTIGATRFGLKDMINGAVVYSVLPAVLPELSVGAYTIHQTGMSVPTVTKTISYTATDSDFVVRSTTLVILPSAASRTGRFVVVKNISTATIPVAAAGLDLIDGMSVFYLASLDALWLQSNGTGWDIV